MRSKVDGSETPALSGEGFRCLQGRDPLSVREGTARSDARTPSLEILCSNCASGAGEVQVSSWGQAWLFSQANSIIKAKMLAEIEVLNPQGLAGEAPRCLLRMRILAPVRLPMPVTKPALLVNSLNR